MHSATPAWLSKPADLFPNPWEFRFEHWIGRDAGPVEFTAFRGLCLLALHVHRWAVMLRQGLDHIVLRSVAVLFGVAVFVLKRMNRLSAAPTALPRYAERPQY